jgi:hypothetical protein
MYGLKISMNLLYYLKLNLRRLHLQGGVCSQLVVVPKSAIAAGEFFRHFGISSKYISLGQRPRKA